MKEHKVVLPPIRRILEKRMSIIVMQHHIKAKKFRARMKKISMIVVKAPIITLLASILLNSSKDKTIDKDTIEELIRGIEELNIEINALKKNTR